MVEQEKWYRQRWIAMGFLCFSLLVISLDTTAMNMALPSISRDLGSSASGLQWIVDAYILVFASLLLTMGAIGDRVGRKRDTCNWVCWGLACSLWAGHCPRPPAC